jgi:hypothetical protein
MLEGRKAAKGTRYARLSSLFEASDVEVKSSRDES